MLRLGLLFLYSPCQLLQTGHSTQNPLRRVNESYRDISRVCQVLSCFTAVQIGLRTGLVTLKTKW